MLRLGPYPPPLIEISNLEELWTEKADDVPLLSSDLDLVAFAHDRVSEERRVEVLEAKPGSVQEHINAVLGFNTCRRLCQVQTEASPFPELETEKREELRERAGEALRAAVQRRAEMPKEKYTSAPGLHSTTSVTTGTPSSSQSEVGSNGGEEEAAWDERRRRKEEERWPEFPKVPPGHFEMANPKPEYFQEQMYEQYMELQHYQQALERQQRDLQQRLSYAGAFSEQAQALQSQNFRMAQRLYDRAQVSQFPFDPSAMAYASSLLSAELLHDQARQAYGTPMQWEKPCSFVDGKVLGTTPSTGTPFG
mmetsp:Transcript_84639/g.202880  ORF Transcript_84639/g.202880 Transcript_84639/m.202880 type:complete len:308 (-) Transcript_84639:88-1011(-)